MTDPCEGAELTEARNEFPPPPSPQPRAEVVELHKRTLLAEIDRTGPSGHRRARAGRRAAVALTSAAVASTAAIAVMVTDSVTPRAPGAQPASRASVRLLDRAARVAAGDPADSPRDAQFAYVNVTGHTTSLSETATGEMKQAREDESYEQWTSVDGSRRTVQRERGGPRTLLEAPGKGSFGSPTYRFLAGLPTDPEEVLAAIYRETKLNHGEGSGSTTGPDQEAFVIIGDLLRMSVAPPEAAAVLYRAAARIPGVVVVPNSVDAAGRRGVAVARAHDGERSEWIFDKGTSRLLGERTVLLKDSAWGKAGTAVDSTAIIGSGFTDKPGERPPRTFDGGREKGTGPDRKGPPTTRSVSSDDRTARIP
ncbi:CU044_5270 family protein [Streptomyces sp. McG3]|uniref:CU044_5270 family protein n=1 Tax=Streptomyces sp. McG3 TaxID=2725483 RepID=UPI001BE6BFD4|nr:CU044_5270 family protein [Streptomyces sp. McG3]